MRKISLNGHIRAAIIANVMQAWNKQNPSPVMEKASGLPTLEEIKTRDGHRARMNEYRSQLGLVLGTFKSLAELVDEWPEMEAYVPPVLSRPQEFIKLP